MTSKTSIVVLFCWAVLTAQPVAAAPDRAHTPSGLPVPRFVSVHGDLARGRTGPSRDHAIAWLYRRRGLPVRVIAETEAWRRVEDPAGDRVWMHRSLLDSRRTVMVTGVDDLALRRSPGEAGEIVAYLQAGVIFALDHCEHGWCRIDGARAAGWTQARRLWGLSPAEAE